MTTPICKHYFSDKILSTLSIFSNLNLTTSLQAYNDSKTEGWRRACPGSQSPDWNPTLWRQSPGGIRAIVYPERDWRVCPRKSGVQTLSNFCKIPAQYQGWCSCGHFGLHPFSEVLLEAINQGEGNHMAGEMCHGEGEDSRRGCFVEKVIKTK